MLDENTLSGPEIEFLIRYKFGPEDVFDGRKMSWKEIKVLSNKNSCFLVLRNPHGNCAHRIRTRSGHCAQCKPAALAYSARHRLPGWIYAAWSESTNLVKIGSAKHIEQRQRSLNAAAYGGLTDWKIVDAAKVPEMGVAERRVQSKFDEDKVNLPYRKEGDIQTTDEIYKCSLDEVRLGCVDEVPNP